MHVYTKKYAVYIYIYRERDIYHTYCTILCIILCNTYFCINNTHAFTERDIYIYMWVVVKIMVPFGILIIIRHLIFKVPQKGLYF